jgi:hypothetical protein
MDGRQQLGGTYPSWTVQPQEEEKKKMTKKNINSTATT